MSPRLLAVVRVAKRTLSFLTVLLVALVLAASCALYLALTGLSLPVLRAVTVQVGHLLAGQRTESLALDVRVLPAEGRLAGTATLTVRSLRDNRQRFYFLLNDQLRVRQVRIGSLANPSPAAKAYQLSLLTVVDLAMPVAKDATFEITLDYDGTPATGMFSVASNVVSPDHVLLNVDSFWYPSDVQGLFTADVTVTVPNNMTVVHNGSRAVRIPRGDVQQVRWTSERPVGGLALVAGRYALTTLDVADATYRVYLPDDVQLDATRIGHLMADSDRTLAERYGASGFKQMTLFVSRDLRRGFNDGSGLMGLSIRYFRTGDYGFATIAHEIAHNWWGATVAEKWLSPRTGGEWIVEGFAEFSSVLAAEAEYGREALTRRLAGEFFDPARQGVVADMSVLDNVLAEPTARDTIYRKGAYVAMMLCRTLGDEACFRGLRQFLERFRYQQVTDGDLQQVLQESSGQDLGRYFADWVRSDHLVDLALDGSGQSDVVVSNLGSALVTGELELWRFKKSGGEPIRTSVHVGDKLTLDPTSEYAVLDPQLAWADVQRENNRYPRRDDPVYVNVAAHGNLAVTDGEALPWVRATVSSRAGGRTEHSWDFDRGLAGAPLWTADAARLVVSYCDGQGQLPAIVTLAADGARRTIGRGTAPAPAADGTVYAAKGDRIVRIGADGRESTVVRQRGASLDLPLPSPAGTALVYTAARGNHLEIRQVGQDGRGDRLVASWDRDRIVYRWSHDGTRLYAIVGGDWDWQVWEIPIGAGAVRALAREAGAITDLAVSPDDTQLAFTAAPSLDYPTNRHQLFVMRLSDQHVRTIDVPDADLTQIAWADSDSLLVVATAAGTEQPWILPATRTLKRIRLADASVEDAE